MLCIGSQSLKKSLEARQKSDMDIRLRSLFTIRLLLVLCLCSLVHRQDSGKGVHNTLSPFGMSWHLAE